MDFAVVSQQNGSKFGPVLIDAKDNREALVQAKAKAALLFNYKAGDSTPIVSIKPLAANEESKSLKGAAYSVTVKQTHNQLGPFIVDAKDDLDAFAQAKAEANYIFDYKAGDAAITVTVVPLEDADSSDPASANSQSK